MALDHSDVVDALSVLNIIPTVEQFERLTPDFWPFLLLAQPSLVAERPIAPIAEHVVREILATWPASPDAIPADAVERYVAALTPEAIARICAEYRAAFHFDRPMAEEDRQAGRRIRCPLLVHWSAEEASASRAPWRCGNAGQTRCRARRSSAATSSRRRRQARSVTPWSAS